MEELLAVKRRSRGVKTCSRAPSGRSSAARSNRSQLKSPLGRSRESARDVRVYNETASAFHASTCLILRVRV